MTEERNEQNERDGRKELEDTFREAVARSCGGEAQRLNQMLAPSFVSCGEDGTVTLSFGISEWELNPRSELHGGAIAAMFDLALGIVTRCVSKHDSIATTDMSISYLRRVERDDSILITIKVQKNGRQMVRLYGEAHSGKTGKIVASAQCSYMNLEG